MAGAKTNRRSTAGFSLAVIHVSLAATSVQGPKVHTRIKPPFALSSPAKPGRAPSATASP